MYDLFDDLVQKFLKLGLRKSLSEEYWAELWRNTGKQFTEVYSSFNCI